MKEILAKGGSSVLGENKLFDYVGLLNHDKIHSMVAKIEEVMIERGFKKSCVKKTFTILIEGMQNALIHGSGDSGDERYLGLSVNKDQDCISLDLLSLTDSQGFSKVKALISDLNQMTKAEIKKHYLEVMTNGKISDKGGAGLGLITMVMKSKEGVKLSSHPLNDGRVVIDARIAIA